MIDCVWSETSLDADNRSHYGIATLVNNALDRAELGFVHRNGFKELPPGTEGAVVIVHGDHQAGNAQPVIDAVARLSWAVTIVIGGDEGLFPSERLQGHRKKVWVQMPIPGVHDFADRKLICGFPHDAPACLELCAGEKLRRSLNWAYSGQVNNANRRACVAQLKMHLHGFLNPTPGFWQGLGRVEYYRMLADCKVAPCPTGAATPDTLRLSEALEAGCVPIAEDRWPPFFPRKGKGGTGYWEYVLGEKPPFPTLTDWGHFPALLDRAISEWPYNRDRLQEWWQSYKGQMRAWLQEDVAGVR